MATFAARQTNPCTGIFGESKLVRAPEKEYFLLIYIISAMDARKKNGGKSRQHFPHLENTKIPTQSTPEINWIILPKSGLTKNG